MARTQNGLPGIYNSSPISLSSGDGSALATDSTGAILIAGGAASGSTDSGNPIKVGGVYNSSNITLSNGQRGDLQLTTNGFLRVDLATLISGENQTTNRMNVEQIFSFLNTTTNTTTTVKSGAGTFYGFTINNNGFTTAGTIAIYDNTAGSGTLIGTYTIPIEPPGTVALATTYFPPQLGINASFSTGLTFVTATTAPAPNLTILYR